MSDDKNHISKNENDGSLNRFEQMLNGSSNYFFDVDEFEQIIDHYLINLNYQFAAKAVRIGMRQHPESYRLRLRRAQIYLVNNKPVEALDLIRQLERHLADFSELLYLKGSAYIQLRQFDSALLCFNDLISRAGDNTLVLYQKIGQAFLTFEQYDLALTYYLKGLETNPNDPNLLYDTGLCYHSKRNFPSSLVYFQRYLDEEPFDETAWVYLAVGYNDAEQYEKALEACDYALALNEEDSSAYYNKANAMSGLGRIEEAIQLYEYCLNCHGQIEEDETFAEVYCCIGECYEQLNNNEKAIENYRHALKLDDEFADAWYGLSMIAFRTENNDECQKYLKKALFLQPANPDYWFSLGNLFSFSNDTRKAVEAFRKAIELNPSDVESWINLSDLYLKKSMLSKAIKTLNEAYPLIGDLSLINYRLAAFHYLKGETRLGMKFFKTGLSLNNADVNEFFKICPDAASFPDIQKLINQNPDKK